ncbi:MAG: AAA-like domain-containing protein, partial [Nannocystaceae bacterium]
MSTRTNLFQVGGAIPIGRLYIERKADTEVVERLLEGEFCHILAPRQIGKSSLRLRAAKTLEQHGVRCVSIDFSSIGSSVTTDQWYFTIAYEIAEELGLPDPELFWTQHNQLTPVHRWYRFIRNELLDRIDERVVVFIDEVDSVLALSFTTDDFFASIRSAYNLRAEDPAYRRLTFCLLGVAAPTDLIQNPVRTPFNIGRGIRIEDFTRGELDAFTPGLSHLGGDIQLLLATIYAWTSGHPYMSQRICEELARQGSLGGRTESDAVDEAAYQIFLRSGRSSDPTLAYVEKRLDMNTSRVRVRQMLHIYRKLLAGERVQAEPNSPIQAELRLMGLAGEDPVSPHPLLRTRNLIFAEVYDLSWLKSKEKEHRLAESVERWLSSGKLDDWLLRGAALEDALVWARGRIDLTTAEHEFLLACVTLARREAEERHRTAEALRKEEQARRSLLEQQRRVEEQRYITDIERERRQRAEDAAHSQNRVISILTVTVAALGALVAVGVWQFILARTAREELDEAREEAQREATDARLLRAASEAVLLAQTPGMETKALITAIDAAGQALRSGRKIPGRIREGIAAAVATSPRRAQILRHTARINSAHFSHDGTRVLTASSDRSARIWDAASGKSIAVFDEHGDSVLSAVFSRDDAKILTASSDRSARLISASSGNTLVTYPTHEPGLARADLSPDGRRVLTVSSNRSPRLWDGASNKEIAALRGLRGSVSAIFSPSGASILSWSTTGGVKLWSGVTGQAIADLPTHTRQIRVAEFSPNEQRIITAGDDGAIRLFSGAGSMITALKGHRGPISGAVFSPEGAKLLTYDDTGLAILWETKGGGEIVRLVGHIDGITSAAFASEGGLIVTTSADGTAKIWRSDSGALVSTLLGHGGPVRGAAFSPRADRVATFGVDKNVRLWNPQSGDLLGVLDGHTEDILRIEFSPSGQSLLSVSADNTARVWDTSLQSPIPTLKGHRLSVRVAGFSPDMSRIVTGSDDRTVRLHDGAKYTPIETLGGHQGPVIGLAFAPRGGDRFVTFAEDDPVARLWDQGDGH